ncbi:hypothetical protein V1Y59_08025 [Gordonia sp. PKS22-38]|uniref:Serine/threonine protein kinase n=1 Tax=Gordonia prachuapensis TaxID=3115651 RepID=A0ABU7MRT3_9ACTN|nr:hypothetical protein [Gordonia sp. PKS22-38]
MSLTVSDRADAPVKESPIAYGWSPRFGLTFSVVLACASLVLTLLQAAAPDGLPPTAIRVVVVVAAVLFLPGIPLVVALRIPGRALSTVLAVSVSVSVNALATQVSIVAEWWSPLRTQTVLLAASLVACALARRTVADRTVTGRTGLGRGSWTGRRGVELLVLAVAVVLFVASARQIDVLDAGRFGVITEVGPWYVLGLILIAGVVVSALRARRLDTVVLSAATTVIITYNTMLVGMATGHTSIPTSFVHRGFIATLAESHHLPAQIDARFSWAGFFSLSAHVQTLTGLPDITDLMVWAPLVSGVILSFGLYAVAIAITGRARIAWLAVFLYHGTNWYQQDYFAPQAMAMIGYTAIIATLFWQLRRAPLPPLDGTTRIARVRQSLARTPGLVPGFGPGRTLAIGAVLLLIITANTVSHQMTPMLTILALAAFAAAGATRYRTLWLAAGLIFAAWFTYGATDYWWGHLPAVVSEIGQVGQSVNAGVGDRLSGDPVYQRMQYLRMAASGGFVLLAFFGWCVWRRKRAWAVGGLVCAAPFVLVFLQSYGGEMIIRAFLLASPTVAPFAALALALIAPRVRSWYRPAAVTVAVVAVTLVGLVETTNRGLNTAFEASTRDEVVVTDVLVDQAPPETRVMSFGYAPQSVGVRRILDPNGPEFFSVDSYSCLDDLSVCSTERMPDYIYIPRQGLQMMALQYGVSLSEVHDEIDAIIASGDYMTDVSTPSVTVLRHTTAPSIDYSDVLGANYEREWN